MSNLAFTSPVVLTDNHARLVEFRIARELDAAGQFSGNVLLTAIVQVGNLTGGVFVHRRLVTHSELRTLAQTTGHFGGPELLDLQQKVMSRLQAAGVLPAGSIT